MRFSNYFPCVAVSVAGAVFGGCSDPDVIYIPFGDSTAGGPTDRDYHTFLRTLLGQGEETFANEGSGGETTTEGLQRFRALIDTNRYPNARFLFYWQGAADLRDFIRRRDPLLLLDLTASDYPFSPDFQSALDAIQANIESVIRRAQDAGLEVFVATYYRIVPGFNCSAFILDILLPLQALQANEYVPLLNRRIRLAAQNTGATLVDVAALNLNEDLDNYFDCNHLSEKGNEAVAGLFLDAMGER